MTDDGQSVRPSEAEVRAFIAGFAVSDECFSAEGQVHYDWNEVLDAYRRGELEAWLEKHRWKRALAIIRSGSVEAVPEGVLGGVVCDCQGECVARGPRPDPQADRIFRALRYASEREGVVRQAREDDPALGFLSDLSNRRGAPMLSDLSPRGQNVSS